MSAHTPGPWHRNIRAGGKYPVIFAGQNQHVAMACRQENPEETESNIDLIAAAPDMLAALEALCADKYLSDPINNERMAPARAAIARAKGQA